MIVLGYDLESTGLLVNEDRIIEVGAVLYDTDLRAPLEIFNSFVRPEYDNYRMSQAYVSPTGIKGEWLLKYGTSLPEALGHVQKMIATGDPVAIVAHNGIGFDKPLTIAELARHQIVGHSLETAHWVDTRQDLPFEKEPTSRKLVHLAADVGVLNPFQHRAIFDVMTMLRLLDNFKFADVLENSRQPLVTLRALVTYEMEKERQGAKELRYSYSGPPKKIWTKQVRENAVDRETAAAAEKGFNVTRI